MSAHDNLTCPKCKGFLHLVIETVYETPYVIREGNKNTAIFRIERISEPRLKKQPGSSIKVVCINCKSRFYSIEHGYRPDVDKFQFHNPHVKINLDILTASNALYNSAIDIPSCLIGLMCQLTERPRNVETVQQII